MIEQTWGDILKADVEALVNTVNCVGYMGRGIAAQFKRAFPANFATYARACKQGQVRPGCMFIFATEGLTNPKYIINFPTKRHWRSKSRMEDIEAGLEALAEDVRRLEIRSIAVPPLGCGLGGLEWREVRPRIEAAFESLPNVKVMLFAPDGAPALGRMAKTKQAPKMTPGRAVLVRLMERYLAGLMDPFVSLLEVHKLMYFMQVAGQPLRLRYEKGAYGPYAENLRHVLSKIEGHLVSGYADGGDAPAKPLELVPGATRDAERFLQKHDDTQTRFERVAELVDGFETPFGLELLSTVHWVAAQEGATSIDDVIAATYAWSDRKKQSFSRGQIELAWRILSEKGWLGSASWQPVENGSAASLG